MMTDSKSPYDETYTQKACRRRKTLTINEARKNGVLNSLESKNIKMLENALKSNTTS